MASRFAPPQEEEVFDVYGGNDFQYSNFEYNPNDNYNEDRKGRSSVPNYMKPTQSSRRRAKSADARPQYRTSSRPRTPVQQTKSYEDLLLDELLQQQFDHDLVVQKLPRPPQNPRPQQQQETAYQAQLSTQDGDHFMDPNFDEPVERIHFEREINNPFAGGADSEQPFEQQQRVKTPQHLQRQQQEGETFDPFGGGWTPEDDKRRWDMQYKPSPSFPSSTTTHPKVQATKSFPASSSQYPTPTNMQQHQVQSTKSFPSSNGKSTASELIGAQQSGDWRSNMMKNTMVLKPKGVKDQVKAMTTRLSTAMSRSSRSQAPTSAEPPQRSKSQPAPERNRRQQVSGAGISRQNSNHPQPIPSTRSRSKQDYGSFDVEYDFYGDGFPQSKSYSHDGSQSDVFQVISRREPKANFSREPQIKPDVVAPTYTSKRPTPVSYADYLASSKIPSARGAFSKVSPTSIMDVNNHSNVHWSKNLSQAPTPRSRESEDNPQSILRGSHPSNNNYHVGYAHAPTQVDFVEEDISPIKSHPSPAMGSAQYQHEMMHREPIPSADESEIMSVAYNEFIESVAAVVIQTTVRRMLAKLRVNKIRVQVAAARKFRYNRKRIEGKSKPTPVTVPSVQHQVQHQRRLQQEAMANARMEYQIFDFAAIRIQSVFRGWFIRDIIKIEHYCATMIQKNARAFIYRNQYQYDLFRIIIAQSVVRRFLVCRNRYIAPDPEVRRVLDFAATMIQARWRGFAAEMRYFQDYRDILISQSVARRWLAIRYVKAVQADARNRKRQTNRFATYGGRRSFGYPQQQAPQASKWSNTRNVPWKPVSNANKKINHSVSNEEQRSTNQNSSIPAEMSSVAKRRAMFESKRLDTVQQDEEIRERAAAEKAELKAMQRRVGVTTSPVNQSVQPQRAKSFSGRIQSQPNKWGSQTTQGGRVSPQEATSVIASDVETEVQSNRTSTSRLMQGWRDRERSSSFGQRNSFDMSSDRAKEMDEDGNNNRLSTIGLSKYLGDKESQPSAAPLQMAEHAEYSKGNNAALSIQDIMRSKRSPSESARIERMEEVFQRVGLMPPVNRPRNYANPPPQEPERKQASPLRKANTWQNPTPANKSQPQWIQPSRSLGESPKTERKLFHDESNEGEQQQSAAPKTKIWRNTRQPLRGSMNSNRASLPPRQQSNVVPVARRSFGAPSPVNDRSKNLMNSLGINTSYASETSTDMSDTENSPSPAFMKRFQQAPSSPLVKADLFGATAQQPSVAPTPKRPLFSAFQIQKQAERNQEEQFRIDAIHAVFERVGLMKSVA